MGESFYSRGWVVMPAGVVYSVTPLVCSLGSTNVRVQDLSRVSAVISLTSLICVICVIREFVMI